MIYLSDQKLLMQYLSAPKFSAMRKQPFVFLSAALLFSSCPAEQFATQGLPALAFSHWKTINRHPACYKARQTTESFKAKEHSRRVFLLQMRLRESLISTGKWLWLSYSKILSTFRCNLKGQKWWAVPSMYAVNCTGANCNRS
jgi:hypothetical protein